MTKNACPRFRRAQIERYLPLFGILIILAMLFAAIVSNLMIAP